MDSSDTERLDKFNGLLLTPCLDKAFDRGLISFSRRGDILISPVFFDAENLGITNDMNICLKFEHEEYLAYHRENVYIKT